MTVHLSHPLNYRWVKQPMPFPHAADSAARLTYAHVPRSVPHDSIRFFGFILEGLSTQHMYNVETTTDLIPTQHPRYRTWFDFDS